MNIDELTKLVDHKLYTKIGMYNHYIDNPSELENLVIDEVVHVPALAELIKEEGIDALPSYGSMTVEDLLKMIEEGGNIKIESNIKIDSPLMIAKDTVIDLNGYTIESSQDVFDVSAKLTIEGKGKVIAASENTCSWCAVFAHDNADVTINGGEYSVGAPEGDYNDLIYARDNAKITINGGTYRASGSVRKDGTAFVLNLKDNSSASIVVNGGTFDGFNPAKANTEPGGDYNFVADGYESVEDPTGVWSVSKVEIVVDENDEVVSE